MNDDTSQKLHPFQHLVQVANMRPDGLHVALTTTPKQQAGIATLLQLPSIEALEASFTLIPTKKGMVTVTGTVKASVHQTCVLTLDAFPTAITEQVELEFMPEDKAQTEKKPPQDSKQQDSKQQDSKQKDPKQKDSKQKAAPNPEPENYDPPDLIIDGHIDLGAVTVEFLALGLDPFPRKPDATFDYVDPADEKENPFAKLIKLVPKE